MQHKYWGRRLGFLRVAASSNRLRMLTASFLVKYLDVDWRWDERHFAEWLLDFDLSANNSGWQWAAFTGCDTQLWLRAFNPVAQSERFDPQVNFISRHLPQLSWVPDPFIHLSWQMNAGQKMRYQCLIGSDYPRHWSNTHKHVPYSATTHCII